MILKVKFSVYDVIDLTKQEIVKWNCRTVEEARNCIKENEAERRKRWRRIVDGSGVLKPFVPSNYLIQEKVGTVASEAIEDWQEGDYSEEAELGGLVIKTRNKNKTK